jgi:LytS/YehU family sensor histidine kinase
MSVDPVLDQKEIAPFLLMPLVENAFKHGLLTDKNLPIKISIASVKSDLKMSIQNAIAQHDKDAVGGIGIENLRKRLQLIYGDRHDFQTLTENNIFIAEFTIRDA